MIDKYIHSIDEMLNIKFKEEIFLLKLQGKDLINIIFLNNILEPIVLHDLLTKFLLDINMEVAYILESKYSILIQIREK